MYNFLNPNCGPQDCTPSTSSTCTNPSLVSLPLYEGCNGQNQFTVYDFLCGLCDDKNGIDVFQYALEENEFAPISYYGFNFKEFRNVTTAEGIKPYVKKYLTYFNNNILQGGRQDKDGVYFGEMKITTLESKVVNAVTNSTTVVVENAKKFAVNDVIKFFTQGTGCCVQQNSRTITNIDYNTNTLTLSTPVTVQANDRVVFLWNSIKLCEIPTQHSFDPDKVEFRKSYFQKFGNSFELSYEDSIKCMPGGMNDPEGSNNAYARHIYGDAVQKALMAVNGAQWFGINVQETPTQSAVTMGIITTIQYYKTNYNVDNIHDLSGIKTDVTKVKVLKKIFDTALKNKRRGVGQPKLIVHCTESFYDAFTMLAPAWDRLKNCMRVCNSDVVSFEIREYKSAYGTIELYVNQYLDWHFQGASMAVYAPEGHIFRVEPKSLGWMMKGNVPQVNTEVGLVKLEELKSFREGKGAECPYKFVFSWRMAQIVAGVSHGAVGIIEAL